MQQLQSADIDFGNKLSTCVRKSVLVSVGDSACRRLEVLNLYSSSQVQKNNGMYYRDVLPEPSAIDVSAANFNRFQRNRPTLNMFF